MSVIDESTGVGFSGKKSKIISLLGSNVVSVDVTTVVFSAPIGFSGIMSITIGSEVVSVDEC